MPSSNFYIKCRYLHLNKKKKLRYTLFLSIIFNFSGPSGALLFISFLFGYEVFTLFLVYGLLAFYLVFFYLPNYLLT